ncbi:protrudin isoform X2 [Grus americana]|uniref:protrudin isoform X2 n=1 Tax=Grus americana TaxID=9117 RepID=UPI002408262D|nr:protrudin isoform X2 [Grus americana]
MQAVERDGAAGGPEGAAGGVEAPSEPSPPKAAAAFDLLELVRSYRRLELYLEPLRDTAEVVRSLLRWQRPVCSLLVCFGLNFLLLTLGQAAWYSVLALLVVVPALLGYLQETCRARPSEPELVRRRYHSVRREDLRKVQLSRQEAIAQVKSFLIQLEGFLSGMCCSCEAVYRVLYWENPTVSSQFYGALLGSVCILYLLPLCWVLAILNSTLFLGNTQFYQVIMELKASIEQRVGTKPLESTPEPAELLPAAAPLDRTPTPTSTEDLTPGSVEEAEEAEPDEEFKDAIEEDDESSQCSADFDLNLPDNGFMSKNEVIRSKVSRLTERLRKRYPSNNFGSCTGCAATFSVLKKRRSCSNCGNSFCSRCCSFKVPKAVMGATGAHQVTETDPDCLKPGTVGSREPRLLGSQRGITLPEDACARCSSCQCQAGGRPALLAMQHLPHQLGPCSRALPTAVPLSLRLSPGSCSKPWVLPGTHCTLPRTCPGPVAWLSDGGATLTTCGPTSTSWVGQNNLRALSLPFPALC